LYIAREIVVGHGGTIAVASSEADGTAFTVELPRV
jgi:signal transduction histidine kinase